MSRQEFQISGITFRLRDNPSLATFRPSGSCMVERDSAENIAKHKDENALVVMNNGVFIGYIPGSKSKFPEVQAQVLALIESGADYTVGIESYCYKEGKEWNNDHRGKLGAITLYLECEEKQVSKPAKKETEHTPDGAEARESFNEGVTVLFRPIPHTYEYEGKPLKSVTRLVKAQYAEFEKEMIAARCEKSYGMKAADICEMWTMNGKGAAGFGTAMHEFMEMYERFGERGLPKMDVLRDIVKSCPCHDAHALGVETLITDVAGGVCGMADRLEMHDGKVRVTDFKFNAGATEIKPAHKNLLFSDLPNNKLSKFRVQLSLYADMLEKSGAEVDGVVTAYVYDSAWERYDFMRIEGILDKATGRF